jgi:hypothetical protein
VNERRLREALRDPALDDPAARTRALAVVHAAYRQREPARRRWAPVLAVAACVLVAAVVAAPVSRPGDAVARWVRQVLGTSAPHPRPALVRVPGGGRLLVSSAGAVWAVAPDGVRRRLGDYDGASWSPRGLYAVVWRGGELRAVEPNGRVHWALSRRGRIWAARWSPGDGYRVAYVTGGGLRIVNGDGTGDRPFAAARPVAPAWQPHRAHVLAYVDADRRIQVVGVDGGPDRWRTRPHSRVFALAWSPDGRRLVAATPRRLLVFSAAGRLVAVRRVAGRREATAVSFSPDGRLAVVRGDDVVVGGRVLFRGPGGFGAVAWSPSGRRLLVSWPDADEWLFLDADGGRVAAVGNIARQFDGSPRAVEWCCAR